MRFYRWIYLLMFVVTLVTGCENQKIVGSNEVNEIVSSKSTNNPDYYYGLYHNEVGIHSFIELGEQGSSIYSTRKEVIDFCVLENVTYYNDEIDVFKLDNYDDFYQYAETFESKTIYQQLVSNFGIGGFSSSYLNLVTSLDSLIINAGASEFPDEIIKLNDVIENADSLTVNEKQSMYAATSIAIHSNDLWNSDLSYLIDSIEKTTGITPNSYTLTDAEIRGMITTDIAAGAVGAIYGGSGGTIVLPGVGTIGGAIGGAVVGGVVASTVQE